MSASSWGACPHCRKRAAADKEKRVQRAAKAYGKVPADEYERLRAEAQTEPVLEQTLREDYELGVTPDGEFFVIYRCECQEAGCDFKHEFRHEDQLS